jgi:DtxR family Mn-dependent transcriptional regulator
MKPAYTRWREVFVARNAVEDYVKSIYKLSLENKKVTPTMVAEDQGVTQAAVTKMVQRLKVLKLVQYARATGLALSPAGRKIALEVIRHHRLIELYLTEALGYSWDQVHEEAEKLEHVISEQFEEQIEKVLGYPTRDPHGAPIPGRDGTIELPDTTALVDMKPGEHGTVEHVNDDDSEMLSFLGDMGMYPGTEVEMIGREPYGGSFRIKVSGKDRAVGSEVAANVFVAMEESRNAS